jgi:transposase
MGCLHASALYNFQRSAADHPINFGTSGDGISGERIRKRRPAFTANLQVQLIGMEACSGAHFLGRALREQGHEVRLMPAQYVKPYVQTNKSDYLDAEAIAEAVQRPRMRFVPIKTDEQWTCRLCIACASVG